jgi:FAD/FMN-containing dehydrogenase
MTMTEQDFYLEKLAEIVGEENLSTDEERLTNYQETPLVVGVKPFAVVRPTSAGQVKELIALARERGINLVTSSSSGPKFREDSVPETEAIIVDMSAMERIVRMDRRNKVALIEPGVTFSRLIQDADEAGLKVLMPLLPHEGKSVIASYIEREPIQIPKYHWDMTDPLLCTELVFGTGDIFRTGSAAGPGDLERQWEMGAVQKVPMGPGQTDLVRVVQGSQGTMGVVTWASVKLEVKPKLHRLYFVPTDKLSRLVDFSYKVLRRKLGDEFLILNSRTLATIIADNPEGIASIARRQAPYTLVYGLSGYEHLPEERVAYQEADLVEIAQAAGVESVQEVPGCSAKRMKEILSAPASEPYYKLRSKGAFLDIHFLSTLDRAQSFVATMGAEADRHQYSRDEIGVYLQPIQHGRSVHVEFTLYYNPEDELDTDRAKKLYEDASRALDNAGAFFSRPYGMWSELAYSKCPDTVEALKKVKSMLDPDGVLNQGKLCFKEVV